MIGFIGLGVMGGADVPQHGAQTRRAMSSPSTRTRRPSQALEGTKARRVAARLAEFAAQADIVFLSLPGGPQVEAGLPRARRV